MAKDMVVVNGGGPVGCLLALYLLSRHNLDVTIFEKRFDLRNATAETGRSINLIMTSRGLFALDVVGLKEKAIAISVPVEGRMVHEKSGAQSFQPYGLGRHEVNYSVSRTGLNAMLIQAAEDAGAMFFFEHELTGMTFADGEMPSARYLNLRSKDIRTVSAVSFFGTDGAGSPTREAIFNRLRATEAPAAEAHAERLGISYKELTFPSAATPNASTGSWYSMADNSLHIWPRGPHFLMGLADLAPTFTGTLYLPDGSAELGIPADAPVPSFEDIAAQEPLKVFVEREYPDVPALIPDYQQQLLSRTHTPLATLRTTHWHCGGEAVLLGDAGHAVVPFFGQGLNLGMECVAVLDRCMNIAGGDLAAAFRAFTAYQKENATAIADMAIENFKEMSYHVSQADFRDRKALEHSIEARGSCFIRSRYYMVTKTLIPYSVVKAAGPVIDSVTDAVYAKLVELGVPTTDSSPISGPDLEALIDKHFTPFAKKHDLHIRDPLHEYYPCVPVSRKAST